MAAAKGKTLPDLLAPDLAILFCGINPGLYSAAVGYHFARPGNRFWPTLYRAGITDRLLAPADSADLLEFKCGLTDLVARSSASAAELTREELLAGHRILTNKVMRYTPGHLAVLGIGAYRLAFQKPLAVLGRQPEPMGSTVVWVLPNPSGLNAHYSGAKLIAEFRKLRDQADDGR